MGDELSSNEIWNLQKPISKMLDATCRQEAIEACGAAMDILEPKGGKLGDHIATRGQLYVEQTQPDAQAKADNESLDAIIAKKDRVIANQAERLDEALEEGVKQKAETQRLEMENKTLQAENQDQARRITDLQKKLAASAMGTPQAPSPSTSTAAASSPPLMNVRKFKLLEGFIIAGAALATTAACTFAAWDIGLTGALGGMCGFGLAVLCDERKLLTRAVFASVGTLVALTIGTILAVGLDHGQASQISKERFDRFISDASSRSQSFWTLNSSSSTLEECLKDSTSHRCYTAKVTAIKPRQTVDGDFGSFEQQDAVIEISGDSLSQLTGKTGVVKRSFPVRRSIMPNGSVIVAPR